MSSARHISIALLSVLALGCTPEPGDDLLQSPIEVVIDEDQPMVVDLVFELSRPGVATAVELDDPGVLSEQLEPDADGRLRLRLRGLAPDSAHTIELHLSASDGLSEEDHLASFTTAAALPGFVGQFEVSTSGAASSDYRLFDMSVLFSDEALGAFVIDPAGTTRWYSGATPQSLGLSALWAGLSLRENGELLFIRDDAALILDEFGHEQLRIEASQLGVPGFHHDILELPNGHFMALSLSFRDIDYGPEGVLPVAGDLIVEFDAQGQVLWTWDSFDFLDPNRRVADFWGDFTYLNPETGVEHHDWTHANALVYEPTRDEVLISLRHQDWIVALDHLTGEVRWRFGPDGDFTLESGTWFWHQHSPQWQPDGSLLLYDNGIGDPDLPVEEARSRAVRYTLDPEAGLASQVWADDTDPFLSTVAGDADRSSSGTVLALDSLIAADPNDPTAGAAMRIRELDPNAQPMAVWTLHGPSGYFSYRAVPLARLPGQRSP